MAKRGMWQLKSTRGGSFWIWRLADAVILSVANEGGFDGFKWRVKTTTGRGNNVLFEGEEFDVTLAKKAAEDRARKLVNEMLNSLGRNGED